VNELIERLMPQCVPGSARFVQWVVQHALSADQVYNALLVLDHLDGSELLVDLMALRDAACRLHVEALKGNFEYVAAYFSGRYEAYCLALIPYIEQVQ
jgi:hypothetical protein